MQSYGIIVAFLREGDSILTWKLQFPALGTIVSYLGNSRVLPWKLQFLMPETTVTRLETGSECKQLYFCTHGDLVYVRFILRCRYFICNVSATVSATMQLFIN